MDCLDRPKLRGGANEELALPNRGFREWRSPLARGAHRFQPADGGPGSKPALPPQGTADACDIQSFKDSNLIALQESDRNAIAIKNPGIHAASWLRYDRPPYHQAMRAIGASEHEIEGFKDDIENADDDTKLAKAINWGASVNFPKGPPTVSRRELETAHLVAASQAFPRWEQAKCIPMGRSNCQRESELGGLSGSSLKCLNLFLNFLIP